MKKIITVFIAVIAMFSLVACGKGSTANTTATKESKAAKSESSKKIKIVTTIFPEYDWVKQILGDESENAEITMLLDNGVDLHSYQPTAKDIAKISDCDLFIYVGGESDKWVDGALKKATNKNMQVINLLDVLGKNVKEEEVVKGMQAEEEEDEGEEEGPEYDEHVWLSLNNAKTICQSIDDALKTIDSDNAKMYEKNTSDYIDKLDTLDLEYKKATSNAKQKTLLFGDRFPFRYMVDDYGLKYYAAFVGCSAETEASFKTISFLAKKADKLNLKYVMTIEKSDHKIAKTIIKNTKNKDQKILTLDSMQSTTSKDVKNGTTYLSVMKDNLEVLKKALN